VGLSLAALFAALAVAFGGHSAPPGARLAFAVEHHRAPTGYEVRSVDADGADPFRLAAGGKSQLQLPMDWTARVSWSRDGERFAFAGAPPTTGRYGVFVGDADGSHVHLVPHSTYYHYEEAPIIAPDGRSVVIELAQGEHGWAFFSLLVDGGKLKRLTPTGEDLLEPSGFTPDGKAIAVTRLVPVETQAATIALGSGKLTVLAKHAAEPAFAPDGTAVMVRSPEPDVLKGDDVTTLRSSDLLVMRPGSSPHKLLTVKGGLAWPSIDPSGQRIAFTRLEGGTPVVLSGKHNEVDEVNLDGSCLTKVAARRGETFAGATWQPGPGRGTGAISC
jgi:dipeptidyl aminopeptidase/acylaminoacyl peptidase